jgi:hypothetical protein
MGNDEISTQVVRLMDWDMQPSECAGSSSEKVAYQIPHLWNGSIWSVSYTFCIRENNPPGGIKYSIRMKGERND